MNFLAHFYVSGHSDEILLGNFVAEFVTKNETLFFPSAVRCGVLLHREIDLFTDRHAQVKKSKKILWPRHRHYSSVIVDIFCDHFLAKYWGEFSDISLENFASRVYDTLHSHNGLLPERAQQALRYMRGNDSLVSYRKLEGIERTMRGMANRARFPSAMDLATEDLRKHYDQFENHFRIFFPELIAHSRKHLEEASPVCP